jgi:hypothetical protein
MVCGLHLERVLSLSPGITYQVVADEAALALETKARASNGDSNLRGERGIILKQPGYLNQLGDTTFQELHASLPQTCHEQLLLIR